MNNYTITDVFQNEYDIVGKDDKQACHIFMAMVYSIENRDEPYFDWPTVVSCVDQPTQDPDGSWHLGGHKMVKTYDSEGEL